MKFALIQLDIEWESKTQNYQKAESFIKQASLESCDVVVLPEMFNTGFSMKVETIGENVEGATYKKLSELASTYKVAVVAGYPVSNATEGKGQNVAVVFDKQGNCISRYAKMHPFSFSGEDKYYLPGQSPVTFELAGVKSSIFICYDLRFPEVFRSVAKEVQVIFVIANWPSSRTEHWEALLKARAIENQCFIIGVNRIGTDGNGLEYSGASHIFCPLGNDVCKGTRHQEFLTAEINPDEVWEVRSKFPFLNDMR